MTYVRAFPHVSELLKGNEWGDPHEREVHVYLPPGYSDRRKDPYPVVFMLAGWRFVAISVIDTGPGIPEELHDRVVEPFFTTKPVGQGSGLGLSMVAGFARQMGGGLDIRSTPEGCTVSILLPLPHA